MLRFDEVAEIMRIIDGSSCDEFVLDTPDIKIVVRRHGSPSAPPVVAPPVLAPSAAVAPSPAPSQTPTAAPTRPTAISPAAQTGLIEVKAPMVGTFYVAPSPGAPPFAEPGRRIAKGDKLGVIEVMKLFTTIFAEQDGRVAQVCANDGELVEYGQTLFVIAPE